MAEVTLRVDGLEVEEAPLCAATLRYFEGDGPFAAAVAAATGVALPEPLAATVVPDAGGMGPSVGCSVVLAWLRPTETLALCEADGPLAGLRERLATAAGGCVVDLSGGFKALRVRGSRAAELLSRLGGMVVGLAVGEARRGRLADVQVLALSVRPQEVSLIVDRAYTGHLLAWIQATLADWT